jgi:hypothetical protein
MRLGLGFSLAALWIAAGSESAVPEDLPDNPCAQIAEYLSDFAERNAKLTDDRGRAEFLEAAINLSYERRETRGLTVEALHARQFDSTLKAIQSLGYPVAEPNLEQRLQSGDLGGSSAFLYDARQFGSFVALNHVEGTMHCSYGFMMKSAQDGLRLGPILENEGGQICWDSTFEVIKVGAQAFPAVVTRDTYFRSMKYSIAVLPTDREVMNVNEPLCTVSVNYPPQFVIAEWFVAPDVDEKDSEQLKSKLKPILTDLASGKYIRPSPDTSEGVLSEEFIRDYDRHGGGINARVPFAGEHHNPYTQLTATYSPIRLDGQDYVLGYGDALFGWRTWSDSAFGLWVKRGTNLVPVAGGFMGKHGTYPVISAEMN